MYSTELLKVDNLMKKAEGSYSFYKETGNINSLSTYFQTANLILDEIKALQSKEISDEALKKLIIYANKIEYISRVLDYKITYDEGTIHYRPN